MAAEIVTASFPGVDRIESGSISFPVGPRPGRITFTAVGTEHTAEGVGDFVLRGSESDTLTFPDCRLVSAKESASGERPSVAFTLEDRRWKWAYGLVDGAYNRTRGRSQVANPRSPRDLASLLASALGETDAVVAAAPIEGFPEVEWYAANPADELAALCDRYGLLMGFDSNNRLNLFAANEGAGLPTLPNTVSRNSESDRRVLPSEFVVACGPTLYEAVFTLEAVGREADGTIRPIDNLSYTPAGGWLGHYRAKNSPIADKATRELARRHVLRSYRVTGLIGGEGISGLNPIGYAGPDVTSLSQLQITPNTNQPEAAAEQDRFQPAKVIGRHIPISKPHSLEESPANTVVDAGHSIDLDTGLVRLSSPVVGLQNGRDAKPTLFLHTACRVRLGSGAQDRIDVRRAPTVANPGNLLLVERRPEIQLRHRVSVSLSAGPDPLAVAATGNTLAGVTQEANFYLDRMEAESQTRSAGGMSAFGVHAVGHAGDIHEVSWTWGSGPPTTRLGFNRRVLGGAATYEEQQREARLRAELLRITNIGQQGAGGVASEA